jgi:hypothetical protein
MLRSNGAGRSNRQGPSLAAALPARSIPSIAQVGVWQRLATAVRVVVTLRSNIVRLMYSTRLITRSNRYVHLIQKVAL